jgi:hypothetical protein
MSVAQNFLRRAFWVSEALVVGAPLALASGGINSDIGADVAGWCFIIGMLLLPVTSIAIWKIDIR